MSSSKAGGRSDACFAGTAARFTLALSPAVRVALMLATAGLYGLSFPPFGSALVAWGALVPLFLSLRGLASLRSLVLAWVSGLAMAYAITDFLSEAVAIYYGLGQVFGALLFVASVSVMCCVSHMLFALWSRSPRRRAEASHAAPPRR